MSKVLKITLIVLLSLLILLGGLTLALRSRGVQKYIIQKVTEYLSNELQTRVSLQAVHIRFFDKVDLIDLYIEDRKGDTLFYFERLGCSIRNIDRENQRIQLGTLDIIGGKIRFGTPKGGDEFNYQFIIDYFSSSEQSSGKPWIISSKKVRIRDTDFRMYDARYPAVEKGMFDPNHLHFYDLYADLTKFSLVNDSISFKSETFSCLERSGLSVEQLQSEVTICNTYMHFDSLFLQTESSVIRDRLKFSYSSYLSLNQFTDSVQIYAHMNKSNVHLRDLEYFTRSLSPNRYRISVSGHMLGTAEDFRLRELELGFGRKTKMTGDLRLRGLNDPYLDAEISNLSIDPKELRILLSSYSVPEEVYALGSSQFEGRFTGFVHDFVAFGTLTTEAGTLISDLNMKIPDQGPEIYSGNLMASSFDLNKLLKGAGVGTTDFDIHIDGQGLTLSSFKAQLNGEVQNLLWKGYNYSDLVIDGKVDRKKFEGEAKIKDENIDAEFNGLIDLNSAIPEYNFQATLKNANLYALKLDTIKSDISAALNIQLRGANLDNLRGSAQVSDLKIQRGGQYFTLKETSLFSGIYGGKRSLILQSDIADLTVEGTFSFLTLNQAYNQLLHNLFPSYYPAISGKIPQVDLNMQALLKRLDILSSLFQTRWKLSPGFARGSYNSTEGSLDFRGNLDSIAYDQIVLKRWDLNIKKEPGELLNLSMDIDEVLSNQVKTLDYLLFNASILPNYVDFTLLADDDAHQARFFTFGHSLFTKDSVRLNLEDGMLSVYNKVWKIDPKNQIRVSNGNISISDLSLFSGIERLDLNGFVYANDEAEMSLWLKDFDLTILSPLMGSDRLGGITNGSLNVSGKWFEPLIHSDLIIENLKLNNDTLGNFSLITKPSGNSPFEMDVYSTMQAGLLKDLEIIGKLNLGQSRENLDLKMTWKNGEIKPLEQFFRGVASEFRGNLSAVLYVGGTFDEPSFSGTTVLDSCSFLVDYTGVRYALRGSMNISDRKFAMNYMEIFDQQQNQGTVSGSITHKFFDDMSIDIKMLNLQNFMGLNTKKGDNEIFYGTAFLNGSCQFSGPINDLYLNINAKSRKGTRIFIPLDWETDNSQVSYISFEKSGTDANAKSRTVEIEGLRMDFNFELTPDAYIELIFDELMDDRIKGSGNGNLKMEINTYGDFNMYGDYIIEKGQYHFTALNFISKEFNITDGGKISWDGNPYEGKMKIAAVKRENAAPADLLAGLVPDEQLQNYRSKIPVDCELYLNGLLFSPDISFGLSFPNQNSVSSSGFSTFNSVVSRIQSDPEELNRQVFSLLVLGSFIPPGFAGSGTGFVASTGIQNTVNNSVGDLISNQVSNWISQLDDRWQFGIDWQSASEATKKELIFSVKRKFLNDRLELDGSVDANAINGRNPYNLNIQYNITSDGRFKVRGFSKFANDPTLGVVSNIFTTGVGFSYRRQFNTFFKGRKKNQIPPAPAIKPEETVAPDPAK